MTPDEYFREQDAFFRRQAKLEKFYDIWGRINIAIGFLAVFVFLAAVFLG